MAQDPNHIKGTRKMALLGKLGGWLMRLVGFTLRIKMVDHSGISKRGNFAEPVIYACWHNSIFLMPYCWKRLCGWRNNVVLTSASKDGAALEAAVSVFGVGAVRGSSSRRAVAALVALRKAIKAGSDVSITPDGPRGPRYALQPGIVKIAQTTGAPILPLHIEYSSAWTLNTWDKFRIPKPFSKVTFTCGEPIPVPADLGDEDFDTFCADLRKTMLDHVEPESIIPA